MKRLQIQQIEIVTGETVEIYNERLNKALRDLKGENVKVEFHQTNPMFAYIRYTITEEIAEGLADEYELKGIRCTCRDCPLIQGTDDRRRHYYWCKYKSIINGTDRACDEFYRMLIRGDIFREGGDSIHD